MNLFEKYRPTSFADVIGQDKAVRSVDLLRKRGFGGRAIWLSGPSGTGKTTIARLIASEVADDWSTIEIDATGLTAADIERIADKARGKTITGRGWCIIVNEAHGLTRGTIRKLLTTMEPIPASTTWIFTTTCEGQENLFGEQEDSHPLLSRCNMIALSQRGLADSFAKRIREIAQAEGLDGKPIEAYKRLVQEHRQNFRACLSDIESGKMLD